MAVYVPRALRSQNASCATMNSDSSRVSVDRVTSACEPVDVAVTLALSVAGDTSELLHADTEFCRSAPDGSMRSSTENKTGYRTSEKPTKIGCRDSGKNVPRSGQKNRSHLVEKPDNASAKTSDAVSEFTEPEDAADSNVSATDNALGVVSAVSDVAAVLDAASTHDVHSCRQSLATACVLTVGESTDTVLPDQTVANCGTASTVTSLADDVRDRPELREAVPDVLVTDSELLIDINHLSVGVGDNVDERDSDSDTQHHSVGQSETGGDVNEFSHRSCDTTEEPGMTSVGIDCNSPGNTAAAADSDADDDEESWEKMFDDSGEVLLQSDDGQQVITIQLSATLNVNI